MNSSLANTLVAWAIVLAVLGELIFGAPKGFYRNHWQSLWGGKPAVAYACLDYWRPEFNDPDAVYVYDAAKLDSLREVDVEVRGKNKMGAWVKGELSCALRSDGTLDELTSLSLKMTKMARPEDGEVPP